MLRWNEVKIVYLKEITEILRNKRIIVTAFIIPLLIYPVVFAGMNWLQGLQEKKIEQEGFNIALSSEMPEFENFLVENSEIPLKFSVVSDISKAVKGEEYNLGLELDNSVGDEKSVWIFFLASDDESIKALSQIKEILETDNYFWTRKLTLEYMSLDSSMISDPPETILVDVASLEEISGHKIGKMLPFILILILVGGCSFAAVDMIAGEKERGCFETILVSPISRRSVIIGKMMVVIVTGLISLVINLLSIFVWIKLGVFKSTGQENFEFTMGFGSFAGIFICLLPITVIIASVLMLISAKAKSYQSGQTLLMPVTFASMIPALAATLPGMTSDSFMVVIPIANVVVGMREMLEGSLKIWPMIVGNLINLGIAAAVLNQAVKSLDKEGQLVPGAHRESDPVKGLSKDPVRVGIIGFAVVWLLFYYIFVPLQSRDLISGLLMTLWGLILVSAIIITRLQGFSLKKTFRLRYTGWKSLVGALIFQTGFLPVVIYINNYLMKFIPIPEAWFSEFASGLTPDLPVWGTVLLMAVSPGICEEVLFRGALLKTFEKRWSPWKSIIVSSLMFGFLHFSIYRLFPTSFLGIGLAWIVVQSNSIIPAMLAHTWNNALSLVIAPELNLEGMSDHMMLLGLPLIILGYFLIKSSNVEKKD